MFSDLPSRLKTRPNVVAIIFLLALSFCTYVVNYAHPAAFFWDENYHIASAQKYLTGTYFMEPHPPLGKLMIALGEAIVRANPEHDQFINTDYAKDPPAGFSFAGYRLIPVLLAWLTTPIIFALLLSFTGRTLWATLLSLFYVFDNALIVHMRSAMLESTLVFFAMLTLLAWVRLMERPDSSRSARWWAVLCGAAFGAAVTTKVFALIFVLLVPFLAMRYWPKWRAFLAVMGIALASFVVVFVAVWQIHFSLGRTIHPSLPDAGYYQASAQYKTILQYGKTSSPFAFPWMIRDSMRFVGHYQRGVPRLNLCKSDENGSPWFFWPFGGRTINYRWESPTAYATRYLYLVPNPVVWLLGLFGVAGSALFLLAPVFVEGAKRPRTALTMGALLTLYICFMIAVSRIDRVMYLYHYFLPLLFSLLLSALVLMEMGRIGAWRITPDRRSGLLLFVAVAMFAGFQFMRPFTYYEAITDSSFVRRELLRIWDLQCVRCAEHSLLVVPQS